jgi:hypothetical protein
MEAVLSASASEEDAPYIRTSPLVLEGSGRLSALSGG